MSFQGELQRFMRFLLTCESGKEISSLNDIDVPPWWSSDAPFDDELLEKTSKKGVSLILLQLELPNSNLWFPFHARCGAQC